MQMLLRENDALVHKQALFFICQEKLVRTIDKSRPVYYNSIGFIFACLYHFFVFFFPKQGLCYTVQCSADLRSEQRAYSADEGCCTIGFAYDDWGMSAAKHIWTKIATVLWEYVHNLMQDDSISIVSDAHWPGHGKCFWQNGRQTTGSGAKANDSHRKDIMNGREHDEKHDETDYFAVTGHADDELRHALRGGDDCYVG